MKTATLVLVLLSLVNCGTKTNNSPDASVAAVPQAPTPQTDSGITPNQLAKTVIEILAELRPKMEESNVVFSKAELTISAKQSTKIAANATVEGSLLLQVKLEGEVSAENETSLVVSYELKDPVEAIVEIIKLPEIKTNVISDNEISSLVTRVPNAKSLKKKIRSAEPQQKLKILKSEKDTVDANQLRIRELYFQNDGVKNAFVKAIEEAIKEYSGLEQQFAETCFNVAISFAITTGAQLKASVGFKGVGASGSVGGSASGSREGTHTLKLSFGKC